MINSGLKQIYSGIILIGFIILSPLKGGAQSIGFNSYDILGREYMKYVIKNDTAAVKLFIDQKSLEYIYSCQLTNIDTSQNTKKIKRIISLVKNDYNKVFSKLYMRAFKAL